MELKKLTKGITLIELLIGLAIFAILILFLANFFVSYYDSFNNLQASNSVSESTGIFINSISNAIRQADSIVSSRVFSGTTYTSNSTTIFLEIPSIDASSNVILGTYDYMVFYLDSSNIYWLVDSNASSSRKSGYQLIASNISSLSFTYDDPIVTSATKVDITITAQKLVKGKTFQSSLTQQVYLRNK